MNSAPLYLIRHFLFHGAEFLRHWYINSFFIIAHWLMNNLEWLDEILALRVTLKYFFQPLYGDYTILGRILGFLFRFIRIVLALILYPILCIVAFTAYVVWALFPPFLIVRVWDPDFLASEFIIIRTALW